MTTPSECMPARVLRCTRSFDSDASITPRFRVNFEPIRQAKSPDNTPTSDPQAKSSYKLAPNRGSYLTIDDLHAQFHSEASTNPLSRQATPTSHSTRDPPYNFISPRRRLEIAHRNALTSRRFRSLWSNRVGYRG